MRFSIISKHPTLPYYKKGKDEQDSKIEAQFTVFGILKDIQNDVRGISNLSVQTMWEWSGFSSEYVKKYGVYPSEKDIHGKLTDNKIYNLCTERFPRFQTSNLCTATHEICGKFKTELKDYLRGNRSIPFFKENQPIPIHKESIRIVKNLDGRWWCDISLLSRKGTNLYNLDNGRFPFEIKSESDTQESILNRIGNDFEITRSQILFDERKKQWFLNLGYSLPLTKFKTLSLDKILGIDLGVAVPAVCAINNDWKRLYIESGEIDNFRSQVYRRRRSIQHQGKWCGCGRSGHGITKRLEPLNTMRNKVSNFRDSWNHKISKSIVEFAVKNGCGTIQMEDLSGISENSKFLKSWSYFDIQTKITYKAQSYGIVVKKINPKYTSQRCSKCGYISDKNRDGRDFCCVNCGAKLHADYNAAKNISICNIDKVIKQQIEDDFERIKA